jgi:hypothetical protein
MRANSWALNLAGLGVIALAASARPAMAVEEAATGHSHEMAELHGGSVTMTPAHHFEVLCTPKEARLYIYDGKQVPILNLEGMKASMVLQEKTGKPMTMPMTYVKPDAAHGQTQGYFAVTHDFSAAAKVAMKATFTVEGLAKTPVEFKSAVALGDPAVYACPMHPDVTGEDPGKCGKCGMNLEKMGGHEEHDSETGKASGHDDHHE